MIPLEIHPELEIEDLLRSEAFRARPMRSRSSAEQLEVLQHLSSLLVDDPDHLLQGVVEAALEVCHADSAGISLEAFDLGGHPVFQWVALAGTYAPLHGAMVPEDFEPCLVCHREQRPQLIRVPSSYIQDVLHVEAAPVTDGLLLPWSAGGRHATLWIVAHEREVAFDMDDYKVMQIFASFASTAYSTIQRDRRRMLDAIRRSSDSTTNLLTDGISNPLQGVTNCLFLAQNGGPEAARYTQEAAVQLERLSELVKDLVAVPG